MTIFFLRSREGTQDGWHEERKAFRRIGSII